MGADRYATSGRVRPGSLGLALGVNGLILFGLSLTAPHFVPIADPVLNVINIPLDPPPPIDEVKPPPAESNTDKHVLSPPPDRIDMTKSPVKSVEVGPAPGPVEVTPPPGPVAGTGDGGGVVVTPVRRPVLVGPELDPRYAGLFQPIYPADMRIAEREGRVVVRVLIGVDGRVKAVEQVSAASAAFFEATRKRALDKWRFKPGTRDGVPVEAWRTMAVRFVLDQE